MRYSPVYARKIKSWQHGHRESDLKAKDIINPTDIESETSVRKLELISRNSVVGFIATASAALLLVAAAYRSGHVALWIIWWLLLLLVSTTRIGMARRFHREEVEHTVDTASWSRRYTILVSVLSTLWAAGILGFSYGAPEHQRFLAALVAAAMSAGAISTLAPRIDLYRIYATPMLVSVALVSFLSATQPFDWMFGLIALVYLYGVTGSAAYLSETLDQSIRFAKELQFADMVYQALGEAVVITDTSGIMVACNAAFMKMSGYELKEIIDRDTREFSSGRNEYAVNKQMWEALSSQGHWQGEIYNRRKNGEEYLKWLTINTIYDEQGNPFRNVGLYSDVTDQKRAEEMAWKHANYDTLTSLPNRRLFHERLEQEIKKEYRKRLGIALLIVDLDKFSEVNDTLGHAFGDRLLLEAASRVMSCVRMSDTVARTGGDEFTITLPDFPDAGDVERIAQTLLQKLKEPFKLGDEITYITSTIGIAYWPTDADDADELIRNAGRAVNSAKNAGADRYEYFTSSMQETALRRRKLTNDLRNAVSGEQLRVVYQPIVRLADGRIVKAEALLRWEHPELGMISPVEFIPLAEESGLIIGIGDWVFREAARWAKRWNDELGHSIQVSINKSSAQFHSVTYAKSWIDYLQEIQLPGNLIVIEITESLILDPNPIIAEQLAIYSAAGMQISIDDFGTGYSSLSYLKKFNADYLKIDQSFVRNIETDTSDLALSEAIILMSHKLGIRVIAEGVETEQQSAILLNAGCDYGQGYLYSRPVPGPEFEKLLPSSASTN
jgi:diguanylate cyclase (GGDEF)-like protein/PAS domain S-box-containing protein